LGKGGGGMGRFRQKHWQWGAVEQPREFGEKKGEVQEGEKKKRRLRG